MVQDEHGPYALPETILYPYFTQLWIGIGLIKKFVDNHQILIVLN